MPSLTDDAGRRVWFTVAEAAQLLERTPSTIYKWISEGSPRLDRSDLPNKLIHRDDLLDMLQPKKGPTRR